MYNVIPVTLLINIDLIVSLIKAFVQLVKVVTAIN